MKIFNAKILTVNKDNDIIENGWVELDNGKISAIGTGACEYGSDDIDADGKTLTPGFIDAHTHLGLMSSGVGIEGEDFNEDTDPITPQLRVIDGINPMDIAFSDAYNAGVTAAAVAPGSTNPIAGEITALKTFGKRIDKMVIKPVGMKFSLGENPKMTYLDKDDSPATRMAIASLIREALTKAQRYSSDIIKSQREPADYDEPEYDAKSEALIPLLERKIKAHFHCHRADDIFTAIRIAKEFNLDYTLIHCTEGYLIADELAEENATAVVGPIICGRNKPELAKITPKNIVSLSNNSVKTAICTDHAEVPIEYLSLSAGIAARNGLSKTNAIRAITIIPAEILGIDDRMGSIEVGKDADVLLFSNDPIGLNGVPDTVIINGKIVKS